MTLAEELEHGVLSKVAPDEPIFVIRAKDVAAFAAIEYWMRKAKAHGSPLKKIESADECLRDMAGWQTYHGTKVPD